MKHTRESVVLVCRSVEEPLTAQQSESGEYIPVFFLNVAIGFINI